MNPTDLPLETLLIAGSAILMASVTIFSFKLPPDSEKKRIFLNQKLREKIALSENYFGIDLQEQGKEEAVQ